MDNPIMAGTKPQTMPKDFFVPNLPMKSKNQQIYDLSYKTFGLNAQLTILMEECAELIKEAAKMKRMLEITGSKNDQDVIFTNLERLEEEIADVEIMTDFFKYILSFSNIEEVKRKKLECLTERLKVIE